MGNALLQGDKDTLDIAVHLRNDTSHAPQQVVRPRNVTHVIISLSGINQQLEKLAVIRCLFLSYFTTYSVSLS